MDGVWLSGGCGIRFGAVNTMSVRLYSMCCGGWAADLIVADVSSWQRARVP